MKFITLADGFGTKNHSIMKIKTLTTIVSLCLFSISILSSCKKEDPKEFGAYDFNYSIGTVYKAPSDGFVVVNVISASGSAFKATLYSDINTDPFTMLASVVWSGGSMTAPIKKGDYWKVTHNNVNVDQLKITIGWLPVN
jgi:hypothetical protein